MEPVLLWLRRDLRLGDNPALAAAVKTGRPIIPVFIRSKPDEIGGASAWQRGRTGYPIVDAGMRQLWATGWMHNRVRMIAASFLIKDQLIHWPRGEAWFWNTLVDADLAQNAGNWQWVAGSGADAAPYSTRSGRRGRGAGARLSAADPRPRCGTQTRAFGLREDPLSPKQMRRPEGRREF
jgi:deoxyribodipyrimidine photolyase